eukprot:3762709-Amphidinium_carterae.1
MQEKSNSRGACCWCEMVLASRWCKVFSALFCFKVFDALWKVQRQQAELKALAKLTSNGDSITQMFDVLATGLTVSMDPTMSKGPLDVES